MTTDPNTDPQSKDSPKTFYVSNAWVGVVLAFNKASVSYLSDIVVQHKGDRGDVQKWTIEYGDEPDTIALQCVANGKYLNSEAKLGGKVRVGDKQWWKMSVDKYTPPGGCRLSPLVESPQPAFMHYPGGHTPVKRGGSGDEVTMTVSGVSVCSRQDWIGITTDPIRLANRRLLLDLVLHRHVHGLQSSSFDPIWRRCLDVRIRCEIESS
jgi:hypothetical protein